jgi:hypothetical protein
MKRGVSSRSLAPIAGAALVSLLWMPQLVLAQDAPAPSGTATPAPTTEEPPAPPRSYPPPPPRAPEGTAAPSYPSAPPAPPPNYPPPRGQRYNAWNYYRPQPEGIYRPFSFTVSAGPGGLFGPDDQRFALTYNLFRLGFGLAPNLSFVISLEGAGANSVNPYDHVHSWLSQNAWLLGIQYHLSQRLYVRGELGAASLSEHFRDMPTRWSDTGLAVSGAVGFEFLQGRHASLALDLNGMFTDYGAERWQTVGADLALSFF